MGENQAMIKLSILTPSIPSRTEYLAKLMAMVTEQIGDKPVEHLILMDNKRRTIGEKRDALLRASIGEYIAFCDDDDAILPGYVDSLLEAIEQMPDVITFDQNAYFDGKLFPITFHYGKPNMEPVEGKRTVRSAWHVCAWRRGLACLSKFPPANYGEDWDFCAPLNNMTMTSGPVREIHIDKVLHEYHYRTSVTEAK